MLQENDTDNGAEAEEPLSVQGHLELALQAATEQGMTTSELMGIFFYYAHSIAETYRQDVMAQQSGRQEH